MNIALLSLIPTEAAVSALEALRRFLHHRSAQIGLALLGSF